MANEMLVSVIIPAYNTGAYIGEMLDCVIHQTYSNMEIIVIDDGSTDNTGEVIKSYLAKDARVTMIESAQGGVSKARNLGIERASGRYFFFWDSDDIVEPNAITMAVRFAEEHNVNAVLYGYADYKNGVKGKPFPHELKEVYRDDVIVEQLMPRFLGHSFSDVNAWISGKRGLRQGKEHTALWRVMLNAETVRKNGLRFDSRLTLGEDTKFINQYFLYETSIGFMDECLYHLRIRENSANSLSVSNPFKGAENKAKLIEARKELDAIALQKGFDIHGYWEGTIVFSAVQLALKFSHYPEKSRKENRAAFDRYMSLPDVRATIDRFVPVFGVKGVPFRLLKHPGLLYHAFQLIPRSCLSEFI